MQVGVRVGTVVNAPRDETDNVPVLVEAEVADTVRDGGSVQVGVHV